MARTPSFAVIAALLVAAAPAWAGGDDKPDPARLQQAADAFDAGVTAYRAHDYEGAGTHFEAAYAAVPSANALRQAIRARNEAGQGSRAATLSALALARYAGDPATEKLARDTIEKLEPLLAKVDLRCAPACNPTVGGLRVPGEAATRWTVYLDPGGETIRAVFASGTTSAPEAVVATAGGSIDLHFQEKRKPAPPPVVAAPLGSPDRNELPPDAPSKDQPPPADRRGLSPIVFGVAAVTTAALGGATIWSGIDTLNNPGTAAVQKGCVGQGTSCPLYQEGLDHQRRTNILAGVTVGALVSTAVIGVFTRWRAPKQAPGPADPVAILLDRGAVIGAAGVF